MQEHKMARGNTDFESSTWLESRQHRQHTSSVDAMMWKPADHGAEASHGHTESPATSVMNKRVEGGE